MDSIINLQKKIVPELTNLLVQRYQILRQVSHEYPIGRRALAARLGLSERVLRAQVDFLKNGGLLAFSSAGMSVTEEGADILKELADYVRKLQDLNSLEQFLCERLDIGRVVIIPGDSDQEEVVKREIGRAAARILGNLLDDGAVGEAFGQYCALDGRQIYMTNNAGLMLQDLPKIGTVIGVAGGRSKAAAILSVIRASRQDILITDEAAAHDIVRMLEND